MAAETPVRGGTGSKLGHVVVILAGVSALCAILLTFVSIWLQVKNYRKPLLQRYVVRILIIVPLFSLASWGSLVSLEASAWIEPFRDVYEAFTIYAFFQLLINFLGGERALIIMMIGRPPVSHPWPLSRCLAKVDISDPHTFLAIKRGILQYTWIKPLLAIATVVMKATGTYKGGYISIDSGYFWSGLIYNVSISVSLYALAMFWICMSADLKPFRPMPKFLCIKGIIFASYWQGFLLSIFNFLGFLPRVGEYTPDNLAAAIQDALICFEMPAFAIWHWYAFSWRDYADNTISAARMPIRFALRDAFGPRDLIEDAKDTFHGTHYEYRYFDGGESVLAHEDSRQRMARMKQGMRYERGGRGKYWIPEPGSVTSKTPLLGKVLGSGVHPVTSGEGPSNEDYGGSENEYFGFQIDAEDEKLFANAKALEFGDWHYPVIETNRPTLEDVFRGEPRVVTASTNRHYFQPTVHNKRRRKAQIEEIQQSVDKGKSRQGSSSSGTSGSKRQKSPKQLFRGRKNSKGAANTDPSQLIDLVVEDEEAEEVERVRSRKEGSPEWNKAEAKHLVRAYPAEQVEEVREGHEPSGPPTTQAEHLHTVDTAFTADDEDEPGSTRVDEGDKSQQWSQREYDEEPSPQLHNYTLEEPNVWVSSGTP